MKKLLATSVFICSTIGILAAQNGNLLTVKLGSATVIGNRILPPGSYTFRQMESLGNSAVIQVSDGKGTVATVIAQEIEADDSTGNRTELVLKSDGDRLQVDKIWIADRSYGFELLK